MNFTREDILKIKWALDRYSVKDSELLDADFPMQYNDTISIVLNGVNKKISIKEFIWQVGLLAKDGIFNVTDIFNKPNITLNEAIKIIPYSNRKEGLVITFLDENGEWRIYQFRGSINQFNNESLWKDLYDFTEYIVNSVLPDEEDLTKESIDDKGNYVTKFKDKEYDPQNFSGMATKILRKHIVEIDDSEFGKVKKNVLYLDDFDLENCIYEIRYDFTLTGNVTIPANCVLEFDGGSISGEYTFELNNTELLNDVSTNSVLFIGEIANTELHTKWTGGKMLPFIGLNLSNKKIVIDSDITLDTVITLRDVSNFEIDGNNHIINSELSFVKYYGHCNDIKVHDCIFEGVKNDSTIVFFGRLSSLVYVENVEVFNNKINNCFLGISLNADVSGSEDYYIRNCRIFNNQIALNYDTNVIGSYGIHLSNADYCNIYGNKVSYCERHAIYNAYGKYNKFYDNLLENNKIINASDRGPIIAIFRESKNIEIYNNKFLHNGGTLLAISWTLRDTVYTPSDLSEVAVYNNLFVVDDSDGTYSCIDIGSPDTYEYTTRKVDVYNNVFDIKKPIFLIKTESCKESVIKDNVFNVNATDFGSARPALFYLGVGCNTIESIEMTIESNVFNIINGTWKIKCFVLGANNALSSNYGGLYIDKNIFLNDRKIGEPTYDFYDVNDQSIPYLINANLNRQKVRYIPNSDISRVSEGFIDIKGDILNSFSYNENSKIVTLSYLCTSTGNPGIWKTIKIPINWYGETKPTSLTSDDIGLCFFDLSSGIEKPIWYKGKDSSDNDIWVDATGTPV